MAGITVETLYHWMAWPGEPYETFRRLVAKAEADLEARMVTALTSKVDVRPELALAILERKFPQRWGKVTIGLPAPGLNVDFAEMLERVMQRLQPANGAALPFRRITHKILVRHVPWRIRPELLSRSSRRVTRLLNRRSLRLTALHRSFLDRQSRSSRAPDGAGDRRITPSPWVERDTRTLEG